MQFEVVAIDTSRKYLIVWVTLKGHLVPHKHRVRVPWRMLNDSYEDVSNGMAHEATELMKTRNRQAQMPLEIWE